MEPNAHDIWNLQWEQTHKASSQTQERIVHGMVNLLWFMTSSVFSAPL